MEFVNIQPIVAKKDDYVHLFNKYFISDCFKRIYHSQINQDENLEENLFNEKDNAIFKDFLINEYSEIISEKLHLVQPLFNSKAYNATSDSNIDLMT
jgi:hypothetical protein